MTKKPESNLQRRIRSRLEAEVGGWWTKIWVGPYQNAGIPDLLGCVEGTFFALEVKRPGAGDASPVQQLVMNDIRDLGQGAATVVRSPEEAVEYVKEILAARRVSNRSGRARNR